MNKPEESAPGPVILGSVARIPWLIREKAAEFIPDPEAIVLAAEGDIDEHGHIMPVWLLATAEMVLSVPAMPGYPVRGPFAYKAVADFDLQATVGSSAVRVFIGYTPTALIRFTNERRETFLRVVTQLKRLKAGEPLDREALLAPDNRFCASCGFILVRPFSPCPQCTQSSTAVKRVIMMLGQYRLWVVVLIVVMLAGIVLDLVPPYLTRLLVDNVLVAGGSSRMLLTLVGILASAHFARRVLAAFSSVVALWIGNSMTNRIRKMLFQKFQEVSVSYYDQVQVGSLMARTLNDTEQIHSLMNQVSQGFLANLILVLGIGVVLFSLDARLAFFVLIPIPVVFIGTIHFWRRIKPMYYRVRDSNQKLSALLNGVLNGIRLVRVFGQEPREKKRFDFFPITGKRCASTPSRGPRSFPPRWPSCSASAA